MRKTLSRSRTVSKSSKREELVKTPFYQPHSVRAQAFRLAMKGCSWSTIIQLANAHGLSHPSIVMRALRKGSWKGHKWHLEEVGGRVKITYPVAD